MRVGLTYDLRDHYQALGLDAVDVAEFDYPETIDAVDEALRAHGLDVERIGTVRHLAERLVAGQRWDLVFNMAEGLHGAAREAQVPALLDAWQIPYVFSDPLTAALCLDKAMTKRVLRDHGLPTPPFVLVDDVSDGSALAGITLPFPLMAKPVREGNSKGLSAACRVTTRAELSAICATLLDRHRQPVLVEPFLPGREFTVGILGTGASATVVAVAEKLLGDAPVYVKDGAGFPTRLVGDGEATRAGDLGLRAWRALGCRDGGRVDLRSDADGRPWLLEVNTFPGLRPGNSDLPVMCALAGIPFVELIGRLVASARARMPAHSGVAPGRPAT